MAVVKATMRGRRLAGIVPDMKLLNVALRAPPPELLYAGGADDPRLGALVRVAALADALAGAPAVVLVGAPDDRGVVNGGGRAGAAEGPLEIRRHLYRFTPGDHGELVRLRVYDVGDIPPEATVEATHERVEEVIAALLEAGARVVLLGGGHDLAYASQSALLARLPEHQRGAVVNVDAHYDVRPLKDGTTITSGTAFRRLGERFGARVKLIQLAAQAHLCSAAHRDWLTRRDDLVQPLGELRASPSRVPGALRRALQAAAHAHSVGVSLDLDAVRASEAPGVSAPSPDGLHAQDLLEIASAAGEHKNVRVLDVMEVCPRLDVDGRTARLAALAVWRFCASVAASG